MKEFFIYFFGQGDVQEFALFTPAHILPILWMVAMILLIRKNAGALRDWKHEEKLRYVLAFALIISDMSYYWRLVGVPALGANPVENLPIGVCGWAAILCSYMLVGKCQSFFDISYFWLLSGSLFALLTPTPLNFTGPTRFRYYQFWAEHTLGYIAIFYMIFVHGMRPNWRSFRRSFISLAVLAVIAYVANDMIGPGANYLYMAKPESTPSILDILPPNHVLRIVIMAAVITLMFFLSYLPWLMKDRKAKKTEAHV